MMKKWLTLLALSAGLFSVNATADTWYNKFRDGRDIPFTQNGTGAVKRDLDARGKDYLNFADFGGKGDNSTDNLTAWNNFVAACTSQGKECYVPAGTYCLSATASYSGTTPLNLTGDGPAQSRFRMCSASAQATFDFSTGAYSADTLRVYGIGIIQPVNNSAGAVGFQVSNRGGAIFDWVGVDHNYTGINIAGGGYATRISGGSLLTNNSCSAIGFASDNSFNASVLENLHIFSNGAVASCYAVVIPNGLGGKLENLDIEGNWGGIYVSNSYSTSFDSVFVGNPSAGGPIYFGGTNRNVTMRGVTIDPSGSVTWSNLLGGQIIGMNMYGPAAIVLDCSNTIALGDVSLQAGATFTTSCQQPIPQITPSTASANQFANGVNSSGVIQYARPSAANLSDGVTGSGTVVLATSPTLVTPTLGVASATSINKLAITAPATSATLTVANGKTLTASNTLTFAGTDGSTLNVGAGGTLAASAYTDTTNASNISSGNLNAARMDATGWTSYTPTFSCGTAVGTAAGKYKTWGKVTHIQVTITITTIGTCSGAVFPTITLPNTSTNAIALTGTHYGASWNMMNCAVNSGGGSTLTCSKYDGTSSWTASADSVVGGIYENN